MKLLLTFLFLTASLHASYVEDLEELGYCVIPEVLSRAEAEMLYGRVWHEFIEKAWPNCRMDDRSNWAEAFPKHNKVGIFAGSAGQTQVMWDVRQDPRIVAPFAKIWNMNDLIVSMDGLSFMCPVEIRDGYFEPWPHVDQHLGTISKSGAAPEGFVSESILKTKPFTIQGQFLFEDSFEGDGGFYCIPKSHLQFDQFAPKLEAILALKLAKKEEKDAKYACINEFFGNNCEKKHVTAPRGSLILWDSRTVHWNQHADSDRPKIASPKVRMVGYLCYLPKARLTDEARAIRKEAFEKGISTGHDAASPALMNTRAKGALLEEFEKYHEDPAYTPPAVTLTPLGKALLGLDLG